MPNHSGWSQGKGSRRKPGRDGGRGRSHPGLPDLKPKVRPRSRVRGSWNDIDPPRLPRDLKDHGLLFAIYDESSLSRDDGQSYYAFLFRSEDWSEFGILEFSESQSLRWKDLARKWTYRVITDPKFRRSLRSASAELPRMWKSR